MEWLRCLVVDAGARRRRPAHAELLRTFLMEFSLAGDGADKSERPYVQALADIASRASKVLHLSMGERRATTFAQLPWRHGSAVGSRAFRAASPQMTCTCGASARGIPTSRRRLRRTRSGT